MRTAFRTCLVLVATLAVAAPGCTDGAGGLPDELLGSWGDTCCGGCVRTFTFEAQQVIYSETCPATGSGGYDADVAEVDLEARMFRTTNSMWFAWYRDGGTLYLYKTNPGQPRPVLADGWWTSSAHYVLARR